MARFRVYAYDVSFVEEVKRLAVQVNVSFGLSVSEGEKSDRVTGTREHRFEFGGPLAVKNLNMSLANSPEGLHFIAGLWDADGGWYTADESHPLGQPRFFGGWHKVYRTKCTLRDRWSISTGKMYVATHAGHASKIGTHRIVTRNNVYGIGVLARGVRLWADLVGSKMILKRRTFESSSKDPSPP